MRIKGIRTFVITFLIISILAGCKKTIIDTPVNQTLPEKQETIIKNVEITDPIELEKLWKEYFYYGITSIFNSGGFSSPDKIDPVYIAQFCCLKYMAEKGINDLKVSEDGKNLWLFPLDTVLEYSRKYFNLESLDLSRLSKDEYNAEQRAFTYSFQYPLSYSSYKDENPWGIHIHKVARNSDDTVTAVMMKYDSYKTNRVEFYETYTLGEREDGSLYFIDGRRDYVNNNLVKIEGSYTRFDKILGFDGSMEELFMIGELEGKPIIAYAPYNKEAYAQLMLVNPETFTVEKKLELNETLGPSNIRQSGERFIICLGDKIMTVSNDFEKLEDMPLPKAIKDKMSREPKYDANGFADVFFGGYDVSSDLSKIAYSDETGLKLYDIKNSSERLLSKPVEAPPDNTMIKYYHHDIPRFVGDGKKVLSAMLGYEGIVNFVLCDLEKETSKTLGVSSEGTLGRMPYDKGLLALNMPRYNEKTKAGEYATLYLDFKTGEVTEIKLTDPGETGYIIPDYFSFVGQNNAAFVTNKSDNNDYTNNVYYLSELSLKSLEVEPKVISVKAAEIHILGVLEDGRIMFWYNHNPSENGICITKKR